jgi:hypothetical protein
MAMKNIQDIHWTEWWQLAWHYSQYALVMAIFAVFVFYNVVIVPGEPPKKSKSSSVQSAERTAWDVTTEKPEKIFTGVLQGRAGDWYRLGVSTMANRSIRAEVNLRSAFNEDVLIGSLDIGASDDFQYHEIIFQIPSGIFSDVKFTLRGEDARGIWSYAGVKLSGLALSRLNVKSEMEAKRLAPTLVGNIEHDVKMLTLRQRASDTNTILESRFVAEADFIENVRLNAKEKSKNNGYVLELREKNGDDAEGKDISIKKMILSPGELGADLDEWGNQSIQLPARLEREKEYLLTLTGTGDASRNLTLSSLQGLSEMESNGDNLAALVFGRYAYAEGGELLSGVRVEDFGGGEIIYSYSLSGRENDFFNLFNTEGSVKFDKKEKTIAGRQQQRTSFTYRFFTVYPFEKFMLSARQVGDTEKEVKLEYSFDNEFWREVPATQEQGKPQIFSLTLKDSGVKRVVYVRVSYNGEDKKTGSFGLDQLSVRAQLIRK